MDIVVWLRSLGLGKYEAVFRENEINGFRVGDRQGGLEHDYWVVKLSPFVGIDEINNSISQFNFSPNPIVQSTAISFSLSEKENTTVIIYDVTGREIKTLLNSKLEPGFHSVTWDATDNNNSSIENGIYLISISTLNGKLTKRVEVIN